MDINRWLELVYSKKRQKWFMSMLAYRESDDHSTSKHT